LGAEKDSRTEREMVRALSHPLRVGILEVLRDRVATPAELSEEMRRSRDLIAYHANTLVKCGCLELVDPEPRRGGLEHRFGLTADAVLCHQEWRRASASTRDSVTDAALTTFLDKASRLLAEMQINNARRARGRGSQRIGEREED
jgi:DNA-binding transcriptional ArsR family regulator